MTYNEEEIFRRTSRQPFEGRHLNYRGFKELEPNTSLAKLEDYLN